MKIVEFDITQSGKLEFLSIRYLTIPELDFRQYLSGTKLLFSHYALFIS